MSGTGEIHCHSSGPHGTGAGASLGQGPMRTGLAAQREKNSSDAGRCGYFTQYYYARNCRSADHLMIFLLAKGRANGQRGVEGVGLI